MHKKIAHCIKASAYCHWAKMASGRFMLVVIRCISLNNLYGFLIVKTGHISNIS